MAQHMSSAIPTTGDIRFERSVSGLSAFSIKVIALLLMTLDHIYYMFAGSFPIPYLFTVLGRMAAPLFIFMVANGMHHTTNPLRYMGRLYVGSLVVACGNFFISSHFEHPTGAQLFGNIFATLFLICYIIYIAREIKTTARQKHTAKTIALTLLLLVPFVSNIALFALMGATQPVAPIMLYAISTLIPSAFFVEGGLVWIILGVGLYLTFGSKRNTAIFYLVFCALYLAITMAGMDPVEYFIANDQWMMVFALPLMLAYNGQRGRSMKWFFYAYYPIHLYALYFLAIALG